jgi:hypothetical protein
VTIELTRSALLDCQEIISIDQQERLPESGRIVPEFQLPE